MNVSPYQLPLATSCQTVGLLGGSFNPAHAGHLHISVEAIKRLKLDQVWWLVSPHNPLKPASELAPFETRIEIARELAAHPRIHVLDFEQRHGLTYSYETIEALQKSYPHIRFVWLIGADNLAEFSRWRRWDRIFNSLPIAILDRSPFSHVAVRKKAAARFRNARLQASKAARLPFCAPPAWVYLHIPRHPASATHLRKTLGKKAFLRHN